MAHDQGLSPTFSSIHHVTARFHILIALWVLVVSSALLIGAPSEAIAESYFVAASNGNDGNLGTLEHPFLTLEKGLTVLSAGDILYVRGGTYQRTSYAWSPPSGTSWAEPVTIKAYQNEKVIVKPLAGYTVFEFRDNSHYIIMDGFTIDATGGLDGIRMGQGGHHMRIINSEIMNAPSMGIQTGTSDFLEFINLKVHDNTKGVPFVYYNGTNPSLEYAYGFYMPSNNNLIKDCEIYRNDGYGIHGYDSYQKGVNNNTIINNKIYDNFLAGILVSTGGGNAVINNLIWGNQIGIQVDYGAYNSKIYHNTIYGNNPYGKNVPAELLLGPYGKDTSVANNILVSTSSAPALLISNGSGSSIIENNLIAGSNPATVVKKWEVRATLRGNLIENNDDPKFKNLGNYGFHLTVGSSVYGVVR